MNRNCVDMAFNRVCSKDDEEVYPVKMYRKSQFSKA